MAANSKDSDQSAIGKLQRGKHVHAGTILWDWSMRRIKL